MDTFLDKFNIDASALKNKKLFLLDMDGTIYEENRLFESTLDFLRQIKENKGRYVFITNNSSKSVNDYVKKLSQMGIPAEYDDFFTSSQATARYIKSNYPHEKVFCMGTRSLIRELEESGISVTEEVDAEAGIVLVGYDTELTYEKLRRTSEMLTKYNVHYIATNPDKACPVGFGFVPDCFAMCEMLFMATGKRPLYIGKPEPAMINFALEKYSCAKQDAVIIGDRLYTDIAAGINAGITSVCVLSGEAALCDIINGDIKPTFTLESIADILGIIK